VSDATTALLLEAVFGFPALGVLVLALPAWFGVKMREHFTVAVLGVAFTASMVASLLLMGHLAVSGEPFVEARLGSWFHVDHYSFELRLVGDHLSLPFATFSSMLVGLVVAFSRRYLHLEPGFLRFFLLLALFGTGVQLVVLAGTLDLVLFGWELVGLTSALLIGFFHERPAPVRHGFRALVTYRACDIGLLGAAVWLHHTTGSASLVESAPWLGFAAPLDGSEAMIVGFLLLWASMGKSAQVPLSGWLPRAMEGPTNSSAIFYGAISIHLGPYLLLRSGLILEQAPLVSYCVIAIGAATALHGTFVGRVQTDIKSSLAYASMAQVGLIFVEIGLGLQLIALVHIVGHATLRSLQILRSPSLLHDHHHLEQALGNRLPATGQHLERLVPRFFQPWLYRHALERGYLDTLMVNYVAGSFRRVMLSVDSVDRWLADRLGRPGPRKSRSSSMGTGGPVNSTAAPIERKEIR
jgi:NADH-quinone oxidoreductase subunit L